MLLCVEQTGGRDNPSSTEENEMKTLESIIELIVILVSVIVLYGILAALPTMWLWNWLMPKLFGLKEIGFLQALGLLILFGFLFKSSYNSKKD